LKGILAHQPAIGRHPASSRRPPRGSTEDLPRSSGTIVRTLVAEFALRAAVRRRRLQAIDQLAQRHQASRNALRLPEPTKPDRRRNIRPPSRQRLLRSVVIEGERAFPTDVCRIPTNTKSRPTHGWNEMRHHNSLLNIGTERS
jgi:hypothetical protein